MNRSSATWVDHRGDELPAGVLERLGELAMISARSGGACAAAIAVITDELGYTSWIEATTAALGDPLTHAALELVHTATQTLMHSGESEMLVVTTHLPCARCCAALASIGATRVVSAGAAEPVVEMKDLVHTRLFGEPLKLVDTAIAGAAKAAMKEQARLEAEQRMWEEGRVLIESHPQVALDGIHVDEGIADLIRVLHTAGVKTRYSCQGVPGALSHAYVMFQDGRSLDAAWPVLERLAEDAGLAPLARRTYSSEHIAEHRYEPDAWEISAWCHDDGVGNVLRHALYMPASECQKLNAAAKHH